MVVVVTTTQDNSIPRIEHLILNQKLLVQVLQKPVHRSHFQQKNDAGVQQLLALRPLLFVCVFAGEGLTPPSSCRRGGCDRVSAATSAGSRRATSYACWASSIRVPRSVPNGEVLRFWRCVWRSVSDELAARMHALACVMMNVHVCMRSHIMINVTHTHSHYGPTLSALPTAPPRQGQR